MRRENLLKMLLALMSTAPLLLVMLHLTIFPDDLKQPYELYDAGLLPDRTDGGESGDDNSSGSMDAPPDSQEAQQEAQQHVKATIAYAISLTGCSKRGPMADTLLQGAAVLGHSIRMNSAANPESGSRYGYKLVAFVHPDAMPCSAQFADVGYELLPRETPVNVTDIRGQYLREHVHERGCCQEKEYLKLYSYQLTDYPVAVHLDVDCLVLKPLDDLFDVMLDGPDSSAARERVPVMHGEALPKRPVDAFYTRDYNMAHPGKKFPGFQGGFLVVRPSLEVFREYVDVILEGGFVPGRGWNSTYGGYWGAMQIQGLCSYFYDGLHPGTGVELNRCMYNQMVDGPRQEVGEAKEMRCMDGREECEDCRERNVSDVYTVHFTQECHKPWDCLFEPLKPQHRLCRELHREWNSMRNDWEKMNDIVMPAVANGEYHHDIFLGHCQLPGHGHGNRYIPFKIKNDTTSSNR